MAAPPSSNAAGITPAPPLDAALCAGSIRGDSPGATGSDPDGSFAKLGLHPGSYDIVAQKGTSETHGTCVVSAGSYSIVEISLP